MSVLTYYVTDTTNIASKITKLQDRIAIDPGISVSLASVVFNDPILTLTYSGTITPTANIITTNIVKSIFLGTPVDNTIVYSNYFNRELPRYSITSSTNPTPNHDILSSYVPGSMYYNSATENAFICIDNTESNAVWKQITNIGTNSFGLFGTRFNPDDNSSRVLRFKVSDSYPLGLDNNWPSNKENTWLVARPQTLDSGDITILILNEEDNIPVTILVSTVNLTTREIEDNVIGSATVPANATGKLLSLVTITITPTTTGSQVWFFFNKEDSDKLNIFAIS